MGYPKWFVAILFVCAVAGAILLTLYAVNIIRLESLSAATGLLGCLFFVAAFAVKLDIQRWSFRTLVLFLFLCASGLMLWRQWDPWVPATALHGAEAPVGIAQFSPAGDRIACSNAASGDVRLLDSMTGQELRVLGWNLPATSKPSVRSLAFSPDGQFLAASIRLADALYGLAVWEIPSGRTLFQKEVMPWFEEMNFTENGSCVFGLIGSEGFASSLLLPQALRACAYSLPDGDGPSEITGSLFRPYSKLTSPDGCSFIGLCQDGQAYVYRLRRPRAWWGVSYLYGFWVTVFFAGSLCWSIHRDRKQPLAPADIGFGDTGS